MINCKLTRQPLIGFLQVGLLNVDGYYNSLLTFIDQAVEEGFINPAARRIIVSAPTAQELMEKLEVQLHFNGEIQFGVMAV